MSNPEEADKQEPAPQPEEHFYLRAIRWAAQKDAKFTQREATDKTDGASLTERQFGFLTQQDPGEPEGKVFIAARAVEKDAQQGEFWTTPEAVIHDLEVRELRQAREAAAQAQEAALVAQKSSTHATYIAVCALGVNIVMSLYEFLKG